MSRFEGRADELAEDIAAATVAEVKGFGLISDAQLHSEIRTLARLHLDAFVSTLRDGGPPPARMLAAARERAASRAREMVPLAALVHSYFIAQREISAAIAREAGTDARSLEAALALIARAFDYNIATTTAMADAYVEVVQGDLAELESSRRGLVDTLLTSDASNWSALTRRAIGLGLDPDRAYVVVIAVAAAENGNADLSSLQRRAAQAIARSSGRPERSAFVVTREHDIVAVLDAHGGQPPRAILERAAAAINQTWQAQLRAGIGSQVRGLSGFSGSYQEARRALAHTNSERALICGLDEVLLFDDLTVSAAIDVAQLIPPATKRLLADATMRASLEALFDADLNIAIAAKAMTLHPNSLRYRLRRIAEVTGRDPRKLSDLLELILAARLTTPPA
jgi:hypothetical protein